MWNGISLTRGTIRFTQGLLRMPLYAQIWVVMLGIVNTLPAIYWLQHAESRVILIIFIANLVLMLIITTWFGFRRILGAAHFLWYPLIVYLLARIDGVQDSDMRAWIVVLMAMNAVSLIIDTVDVVRWIRGDRDELVDFGE